MMRAAIVALLAVLAAGCHTTLGVSTQVLGPGSPPGTWTMLRVDGETTGRIYTVPSHKGYALARVEVVADEGQFAVWLRIWPDGRTEPATDAEDAAAEEDLRKAVERQRKENEMQNSAPPGLRAKEQSARRSVDSGR